MTGQYTEGDHPGIALKNALCHSFHVFIRRDAAFACPGKPSPSARWEASTEISCAASWVRRCVVQTLENVPIQTPPLYLAAFPVGRV